MDELIEKIIQIENNAQEITRQAKDQQKHLPERIDEEVSQLKARLTAEAEHRLEMVKQTEQENADAELQALRSRMDQARATIEQKRAENQDRWEDEIFRRITQ